MYGWRARLGVMLPSGNIVTEPEFELMKPTGVSYHYQRFDFPGGGIAALEKVEPKILDASTLISHTQPSAIALSCTGASFIGGFGYDKALIQKMQARNGNIPTTTTSTAIVAAFQHLGIKRISMGAPYVEDVVNAEKKFLEDSSIKVVKMKWLGVVGAFNLGVIPRETIYKLAKEVDTPDSEAVFLSCVGIPTIDIIEMLEHDLKKPVISSNQATMWQLLRMVQINEPIHGFGRLLTE